MSAGGDILQVALRLVLLKYVGANFISLPELNQS